MRKKVTLQYIAKDAERTASYKKRKKGFLKKVSELSNFCGVDACVIITSEYDPELVVWPPKEGVDQVINRFNNLSVTKQTRKMVNQETFTKEKIKKLEEQLKKLRRHDKKKEMTLVMNEYLVENKSVKNLNLAKLYNLESVIKQNLRDISMRLEDLEKEDGIIKEK